MKASTSLAGLDPGHKLYGGPVKLGRLVELAQADFAADGIDGDIAIAGGALDGVERVLQTQLRPGDRVAVEDPCWPRITDLVRALGLQPEPVRVDQRGPVPHELARALARGARAAIVTHAARTRPGRPSTPSAAACCATYWTSTRWPSSSRTTTSRPSPARPMSRCTNRAPDG
jgi:hypothetical protein